MPVLILSQAINFMFRSTCTLVQSSYNHSFAPTIIHLTTSYAEGMQFNTLSPKSRVVTKISSSRVNTTSRRGIKRLEISFGSIFLLFSNKSSRGPLSQQPGKSPAPALNGNPGFGFSNLYHFLKMRKFVADHVTKMLCLKL